MVILTSEYFGFSGSLHFVGSRWCRHSIEPPDSRRSWTSAQGSKVDTAGRVESGRLQILRTRSARIIRMHSKLSEHEHDLPGGPDPLSRGERRLEAREGPGHSRRAARTQIEYVRTTFHRHTQMPRFVSIPPNRHRLEPGDLHQLPEHRFLQARHGRLGEPFRCSASSSSRQ